MQSMYIVYGENEMERKHLEDEFFENSGLFAVPFSHVQSLHDLIDKTCCEFYQKDESIFIEKLKSFIAGITNFSFSFPLWREILTELKRKDVIEEHYRKYLIQMDKFFLEEKHGLEFDTIEDENVEKIDNEFENALKSYKSLEVIDLDEPFFNFGTFSRLEKNNHIPQPQLDFEDKISVYESEKTSDKSIKRGSKKSNVEIRSTHKIEGEPLSFIDSTPVKNIQNSFDAELIKFSQSAVHLEGQNYKNSRKSLHRPSNIKTSEEFNDFINSFKKQRTSPVAEMILQDESFNKIVKKEKKTQKERKKLEDELYEKTKTVKSKEYNRNIKTILLNKKIKDRKKSGFEGQKSQISGVVGAYELRRVSSEVFKFEETDNLKLFKSAGKSVFSFKN